MNNDKYFNNYPNRKLRAYDPEVMEYVKENDPSIDELREFVSDLGPFGSYSDSTFRKYKGYIKDKIEIPQVNHQETPQEDLFTDVLEYLTKPIEVVYKTSLDELSEVKTTTTTGIFPVSDWHIGELVSPTDMANQNEYNVDIAIKRCARWIDWVVNHKVDDIVIAGLGDHVSGELNHEGFNERNQAGVVPQQVIFARMMINALIAFSKRFRNVRVYNIVGNHGRTGRARRMPTHQVYNNYDWGAFEHVRDGIAGLNNVSIHNSMTYEDQFTVQGKIFQIMHGYQLPGMGQTGNIRNASTKMLTLLPRDKWYDYLLLGHFHRIERIETGGGREAFICGTLKGGDGYTRQSLFVGGYPRQMSLTMKEGEIVDMRTITF